MKQTVIDTKLRIAKGFLEAITNALPEKPPKSQISAIISAIENVQNQFKQRDFE